MPPQSAEEAIPALLDEYGGRMYALARRLCGSPEEAEDLVQDVFLQAYRKWDQFEGRSKPSTWLYTIAVRACRRRHRRKAGEPERIASIEELAPFGEPGIPAIEGASAGASGGTSGATSGGTSGVTSGGAGGASGGGGGVDELIRREALDALQDAIVDLPIEFRLPLVLKELAGLSVDDVAAILGVKANTVKTRLHRARLKLRNAMASTMPQKPAPPAAYPMQVCLDLLEAKQEALDRGVPFPDEQRIICQRCRSMFQMLDLEHDLCRQLATGDLPPDLRTRLLEQLEHTA